MLAQIPTIDKYSGVNLTTFKGGFVWGVNFVLPNPAQEDGYIVQMIKQDEVGTINRLEKVSSTEEKVVEEKANRTIYYWEAWEVKKGEVSPRQQQCLADFVIGLGGGTLKSDSARIPVNDIFYRKYGVGSQGTYTIEGWAGFYHTSLTSDFITAHPQTGAGQLRSTTTPPDFFSIKGFLHRKLSFTFDFMANVSSMIGNVRPNPPLCKVHDYRELAAAMGF